jgi:hypothetical protein
MAGCILALFSRYFLVPAAHVLYLLAAIAPQNKVWVWTFMICHIKRYGVVEFASF